MPSKPVQIESLWSQNDETFYLKYQYILAFSNMIIIKLLKSESGFEKCRRKVSKNVWFSGPYLGIFAVLKGQLDSLEASSKNVEAGITQFLPCKFVQWEAFIDTTAIRVPSFWKGFYVIETSKGRLDNRTSITNCVTSSLHLSSPHYH